MGRFILGENAIHILVLEDSLDDLELIQLALNKADFGVELHHASGKEAYENLLETTSPDVVLSDYNLPGYDVMRAKKALDKRHPDVPFILITGALADEEAVELIVNNWAEDYILKDNLSRLLPAIKREYDRYLMKKGLAERNEELKKLSLVAEKTHNGIVITDAEGRVEWVNEAYTRISGYSLSESVGKKPGHVLQGPETDPKAVSRIREKLDKKIAFSEEVLNYAKDGTAYWIKLDITPIMDASGSLVKYIATQEDITKRKEATDRLEESNRRLIEAQSMGKIGDWAYDVIEDKVEWSKELYTIYNRPEDQDPPSFSEILEMAEREGEQNTPSIIQEAIESGTPYDIQVKIEVPETKYIRAKGQAERDEKGEVVRLSGTVQDITDQKRVEMALRDKTEQVDDIIKHLEAVILKYVLYPDGKDEIIFISDNVEKVQHIPKAKVLEDPENVYSLVYPDDLPALKESIRESAENLSIWDHIWRQKNPDGSTAYLHGKGIPQKQDDGSIIWDTITVDETESIRKDKAEKELESLLKSSLSEIFIFDAKSFNFVFSNTNAVQNTGYSEEEIKELTPLDINPGYTNETFIDLLSLCRKTGEQTFETVHTRKDGTRYDVLVNLRFDNYKGRDVFVANILDITELNKARQRLSRMKHLTEIATDGADVGLWELDLFTGEVFFNEKYFSILGYDYDENRLSKDFFDEIIHPDDGLIIEKNLKKINAKEIDRFVETIRLRSSAGEYKWILDKAKVVGYDENGAPKKLAGSHLDITDLKNALDEKDVLIQEIHHRVKNNLAIISGLIELQIMRDGGTPDKSLVETMNRIQTIAIVHEQLYNTDSFNEVNVSEYFNKLIEKTKLTIVSEHEDIKVNFHSALDTININLAVPLGLLINELFTNSVEHAFPDDTGVITIRIDEVSESVSKFIYEDSGKGFDTAELEVKNGFGLKLIHTLIKQITGDYEFKTDGRLYLEFDFQNTERGAHSNI